ncbi:C-C motif chemokine 2-like [Sinocyclocheilus rhinocerous]|uniref:C-C motif chemokine 2-like n=1 Tax=Sinocyclocheilus rhinocerous TaxID=307959 RepID=A0A673G603_9TELE|nr:PREDICTED: C-C motif chemokine 2-like [Sinocyclocheilus rhinocerous]
MRSLMSVLFLVLFCSVQMTSSAVISIDAAQSKCCGEFTDVKIPLKQVTSYYRTTSSSSCVRRAIVFQTKSGKEFCVDPETPWVSGYIAKVDKRTTV